MQICHHIRKTYQDLVLVWEDGGGEAEEKSQSVKDSRERERERLGDWSRLSQSPLSKGIAPVTAC